MSGGQPHFREFEPGVSPETVMSGGHPLIPTSESDQPFLTGGCLPLEKALAVDVHLFWLIRLVADMLASPLVTGGT